MHSVSRLLLTGVLLFALCGPLLADGDSIHEARRRICAAALKQTRVHHALRFDRVEPAGTQTYHAECFHDETLSGVTVLVEDGESPSLALLLVADAERLVKRGSQSAARFVLERAMVASAVRYWEGARKRLTELFPATPTRTIRRQLSMHLEDDGDSPTLSAALAYTYARDSEATLFEWCDPEQWRRAWQATYSDGGKAVTVGWPGFDMTFALDSGLPIGARIPKTSTGGHAHARAVPPRWTAKAWRERITAELARARDVEPDGRAWDQRLHGGMFGDLVSDVLQHVPPAQRTESTMRRIAAVATSPLATRGYERPKVMAMEAGSAACSRARYAGWSEVHAFEFGLLVRDAYLAAGEGAAK